MDECIMIYKSDTCAYIGPAACGRAEMLRLRGTSCASWLSFVISRSTISTMAPASLLHTCSDRSPSASHGPARSAACGVRLHRRRRRRGSHAPRQPRKAFEQLTFRPRGAVAIPSCYFRTTVIRDSRSNCRSFLRLLAAAGMLLSQRRSAGSARGRFRGHRPMSSRRSPERRWNRSRLPPVAPPGTRWTRAADERPP